MNEWVNPVVDYEDFFIQRKSPSSSLSTLEDELDLRFLGAHLIQRAGRLLKMPQAGTMTAQVLFQQFYCQKSFNEFLFLDVAMGCTLIAGKVEECIRRIRDVVNIFHWLYHEKSTAVDGVKWKMMGYVSDEYYQWRETATKAEMQVLRQLAFHVQPRHPSGLITNYLNALELSDDPRIAQKAINYANDALRGVVYVCHQPNVIACAAIQMAADDYGILLPMQPEWFLLFDVEQGKMNECCQLIRNVYGRVTALSLNISTAAPSFNLHKHHQASKTSSKQVEPVTAERKPSPPLSHHHQNRSRSRSRDNRRRSSPQPLSSSYSKDYHHHHRDYSRSRRDYHREDYRNYSRRNDEDHYYGRRR